MMDKEIKVRTITKKKTKEFEVLVKDNMKRAYFSALGFLGSHDAAMDISQEAFIRTYRNFNKYDTKRNFFTWYYKILRNLCLNFIHDNKNRKEELFLESRKYDFSHNNPQQNLEEEEELEMLHVAINQLETGDREIIVLREFEEQNRIKEVLRKMKLKNPSREVWDGYWLGIYNRVERGIAWIAISIGAIIFFGYASIEAVNSFINDTHTPPIVKVGISILVFGALVLIFSLLREKFFTSKHDKYKEVQR